MNAMIRLMPALALAAAGLLRMAPVSAQIEVDRRFAISPDAYVRIHNLTGSVTVTGWDRDSVVVQGSVHEPPAGEGFYLGVTADAAKLGVWSNDATDLEPSTFDIRVPAGARVWIKTASADVRVTGITGGVDVSSVTGAIGVTGSPSELFAETLGGRIEVDADARAVRAKTASGMIAVRGTIRDIVATSVSGDLLIVGDRFERGSFESVDGDIHYSGNIGRGSALDFTAHNGTVEIALPADASADFVVGTFYGRLDDRLGVRTDVSDSGLKGQEYRFTLGSGGGQVTVRNFKGLVVLRRKG